MTVKLVGAAAAMLWCPSRTQNLRNLDQPAEYFPTWEPPCWSISAGAAALHGFGSYSFQAVLPRPNPTVPRLGQELGPQQLTGCSESCYAPGQRFCIQQWGRC
eukprot:CAMPEP_0117657650 /NCGR_PEP_ID=MMETSP0804-20121206/5444_1 /TAXON_ID=1074897 /ORGANISM="Tetraselmis astigmatica, Strain CCMP880" /LENGTH=102 /DNA_ID=CAMNT_0005464119 /DNA_START=964 /DNA_END=1269 /DNA_ORIENTATION=+